MSPLRHHYRHPPASRSRHHIGNSALPPLPPMHVNARSHSLDGLLDTNGKTQWSALPTGSGLKMTAEGLNNSTDNVNEMKSMTDSINQSDGSSSKDTIRTTTNRRSKSLDDLLDDDQLLIVEDERETQSMENILENTGVKSASNESIDCSVSPVPSEKMCENEVMMVDSSMMIHTEPEEIDYDREYSQNDSGIQCDANDTPKLQSDNSSLDDDISNTISITSSTASDKKSGKTFLNKYVKKVKNLMKK